MKNKSSLLLVTYITLILLSTSCTSFQYITLESNLPKSQHNDFFFENDTVQIIYSFDGQNCPVKIDIYNKLKSPLYIDWDKSAIIINGVSKPLKPDLSSFTGNMSGLALTNETISFTEGSFDGNVKHSERLEFIPPESQLLFNTSAYQSNFINTKQADSIAYRYIYTTQLNYTKVKEHYYSRNNAPLNIRCYITYSDNPEAGSSHSDSNFWVSNVFNSNSGSMEKRPDQYHVSRISGFGSFVVTAGALGVIIFAAAIKSNTTAE